MYKPKEAKLFGAALKRLLHEKGLSDRQFVKQAGLEPSYVSKLLNPKPGKEIAEPKKKTRQQLAQGLGITEQELLEQIARYSDSEAEKTISAPPGLAESEEAIAKSHQKLVEPVKALASKLSFQQKVDYTLLQNLLTDEKWREADKETLTVMLQVAGREQEGWFTTEHIENFPCQDLQTIDQLWKKYSNERFGLSIQKRIWESVGGTSDADYRTVCYFGNHVGWRRSGRWLSYGNRTFNHLSPKGHLPYLCFQIKLPDLNLLEFAELFNFEEGLERVRDFGVHRLFNLVHKCKL
jgi:transcriptional regulator with XRE-family HTH domain